MLGAGEGLFRRKGAGKGLGKLIKDAGKGLKKAAKNAVKSAAKATGAHEWFNKVAGFNNWKKMAQESLQDDGLKAEEMLWIDKSQYGTVGLGPTDKNSMLATAFGNEMAHCEPTLEIDNTLKHF